MSRHNDHITIIGAGPAGLTAAIALRRHGFPVTIYESAATVGHRLNGDFQGLENWSSQEDTVDFLRRIGVETNFRCVPQRTGLIYAPGMAPRRMNSEKPLYYLIKRGPMAGTLDTGLKEQALGQGVEIRFNHRLEAFPGRAIVGTGPKGADSVAIAVGMTFETDMEDTAIAVLDDEIAPKGYAYLLTDNGEGTMVTVLYRDFRKSGEYFEKMKAFFAKHVDMDIGNGKRFGSYGTFFLGDTQTCNGKIYVGESAGFQDFLWGFGMRYAITSGYLAARSIIEGGDYDALWKQELRPMLEASLVNRYLLERSGDRGYRYLARHYAGSNPRRFLRRQYGPSLTKKLLLPLATREYRSRVKALQCIDDPSCIWCRCEGGICV